MDRLLFVGSCFAENIGRRFVENQFDAVVNPYGTMYNPASVGHTVERWLLSSLECSKGNVGRNRGNYSPCGGEGGSSLPMGEGGGRGRFSVVVITLGTGEIVDNCMKRPQRLFREEQLSVDECVDYLSKAVGLLKERNPEVKVIFTVSPIRYAKYGFHGSQLSKATLLLAVDKLVSASSGELCYFPAYEIMNDELRDYRFIISMNCLPKRISLLMPRRWFVNGNLSKRHSHIVRSIPIAKSIKPFLPRSQPRRKTSLRSGNVLRSINIILTDCTIKFPSLGWDLQRTWYGLVADLLK